MDFWEAFKTIAAGVGIIATFSATVYGIYSKIKGGTKNAIKKAAQYGVQGELQQLSQSVAELNERLIRIQDELDSNTRLTLKLELKSLYRNHPNEILVIKRTWQKYHDLNGDSYIDDMHEEWKEKYEKPYLEKTFKKGGKK